MSEVQRTQWLMSIPACAEINSAMQELCDTEYITSSQHKDVGKSRVVRDEKDTWKLVDFLRERNPFDASEMSLRNIETGVTADQNVNVDNAKVIGDVVVSSMLGKNIDGYTFKRSQQAVTLNDKTSANVSGEVIAIDSQLLFQRLTTVADRYTEDITEIFQYELCGVPSFLFDNTGLPREPQKSNLADYLWKLGDCEKSTGDLSNVQYVIDGGSLLQKIPWHKCTTYDAICHRYKDYLLQKYNKPIVVLDGYTSGPSTKDVAHFRRSKGVIGTRVKFSKNTPFKSKKDTFLRNTENKQNFLLLLGDCLSTNGLTVRHATADADVLIVQTAIDSAINHETIVIGEDTDLLVLLLYHAKTGSKKTYFRSDSTHSRTKHARVWDVQKTKLLLGEETCRLLPFIYALTGCDTTSRLFGIGKGYAVKELINNNDLRAVAHKFIKSTAKDDIAKLGEKALVCLFGGSPESGGLDMLRYTIFATKVMTSTTSVQVQSLPPTSAAAVFHSYRVYLQTQTWAGNDTLNPLEWGWDLINNKMVHMKTSLPPAPEYLLKIIRCSCKTNCDSRRCGCRKHGLQCTIGCGDCKGISCSNSPTLVDADIDDNE